jgi:hypothetical protein
MASAISRARAETARRVEAHLAETAYIALERRKSITPVTRS